MNAHNYNRRDFMKKMGAGAAAMALPANFNIVRAATPKRGTSASARTDKPNIILFLTDDQGWTDTSVQMMASRADSKSDFYQTPNLERMAKEGMVFSNAYSPAPTCTPTRGSIQFGKTPARLRQTVVHDVLAKSRGIDCKNEIALPRMIKSADPSYVTAHFGKWGFHPRSPEHAGYDVTDGNTNNGDGDWISTKDRKPLPQDDPKRIFSLTRRANKFMEQQVRTGRHFFMQISHYAVHVQHYALKETIEKYKKLPPGKKCRPGDYQSPPPPRNAWMMIYAAMIEDLDTGLGMLLDKINELGIKDNTYVLFTSDNGGGFRGNAPLRGGKASLWEGGIRVPTVVCGPGVIPGCQCDAPVAGWDFYPTINDLIGNKKPLSDGIDGGSLRSLFEKGNKGKVSRSTEALIFHFPWYGGSLPMSAIRLSDYKLVMNLNTQEVKLFNLAEDISESQDLSKKMPRKTSELRKKLLGYLQEVNAETIDDMLNARRNELEEYIQRELAKTRRDEKKSEDLRSRLQELKKIPLLDWE